MNSLLKRALISIVLLTLSICASAEQFLSITPTPPSINASAYVLMDANSGTIIASNNMDSKIPPASLTKMMTLFVISRALNEGKINLDDQVRISKKAWKMGGSKMFVEVNKEVRVRDLIQGIVVDSGNDASVAMAEYIAGSEESFVSLMNTEARELGMLNTHFTDATGLTEPEHYSTAHDLAILASTIATQYPEEYKWYSQKWFTYADIKQSNRNHLLWQYKYADGIKTGHTDAAQYCLVGSAEKDGMRLVSVVLGAPTDNARTSDSEKLLTFGFRFFKTVKLFDADTTIATARVYFAKNKNIDLGINKPFYITVPDGVQNRIKTATLTSKQKVAPIAKGEALGEITVSADGKTLATLPLLALQADPKGSFMTSIVDSVAMAWSKWS